MATRSVERSEATNRLHEWLKPGDTVYTVLRHVSSSGMSRTIDLLSIECGERGPQIWHIGWNAATAMDRKYDRQREGVKVGGAGMDMGFALVYDLSATLFWDGFGCIGEGCPSNDHSTGDRDYTPYRPLDGAERDNEPGRDHWHKDGGYALRQRWL